MKKEYNKLLILGIVAIVLAIGGIVFADTNGVWHRPEDIQGGTFGVDEQTGSTNYTFINPVDFNETITVNNGIKVDVIRSNSVNGNVVIQLG